MKKNKINKVDIGIENYCDLERVPLNHILYSHYIKIWKKMREGGREQIKDFFALAKINSLVSL